MEFTSGLKKFESNLWGHHVEIPAAIAEQFIDGTDRRVICVLNDAVTINSSIMSSGEVFFILINKNLREKLALKIGSEIKIRLSKDHSTYGMPMPEEFATLLEQDETGSEYFHALTPGKQRALIYMVSKVKNFDSRLNKALAILFHLKEQQGKLDFKQLNLTIKAYNKRGNLNL